MGQSSRGGVERPTRFAKTRLIVWDRTRFVNACLVNRADIVFATSRGPSDTGGVKAGLDERSGALPKPIDVVGKWFRIVVIRAVAQSG